VGDIIHLCYESGGLWLYDIKALGVPVPIAYFIPKYPKERRGLLPKGMGTQTENILIDARGYIYITDKNHGLFILRHVNRNFRDYLHDFNELNVAVFH
jgi:hypothetical protein